jgi:ubiquinone/menaquinone biosynthesis C-methylase UbiE
MKLTTRLGHLLGVGPGSRVLDVASGNGASAICLAERFGCEVLGVDYSDQNVQLANSAATDKGLHSLVRFQQGDAEDLAFPDGTFDAIVCECAFCVFPNKSRAVHEFARVLRSGGRVGLSDLTRGSELPVELHGLLAWIACIADAQPVELYHQYLLSAGMDIGLTELHDDALADLVRQIQGKLLGAEIMAGLKRLDLTGVDLTAAKQMAKAALKAIEQGQLGYIMLIAEKMASL